MFEVPKKPPSSSGAARHILSTAGTMIGISTTLIGFVRLIESGRGESPVDEYAAGVAVLFLFSAIFSYVSIRTEARATLSSFTEQVADNLFLVALLGLTTIAIIFAYEAL